jgi:hypothetical protein
MQVAIGSLHVVTETRIFSPSRRRASLGFDLEGIGVTLSKALDVPAGSSAQRGSSGIVSPPLDYAKAKSLLRTNEYHSACIAVKTDATVGLGLADEQGSRNLDEICDVSFQDLLNTVCEEYWQTGCGYIEVSRDDRGRINGLFHVPAEAVLIVQDRDPLTGYPGGYFEVDSEDGVPLRFAIFGELVERLARHPGLKFPGEIVSLLGLRYGCPSWLSALARLELDYMVTRHQFDFFLNRGVPELLVVVTGGKLTDEDFNKLEVKLQNHIGLGNAFKSAVLNSEDPDIKIEIEKLSSEKSTDGQFFDTLSRSIASRVVSAHRVPPPLAGIETPGKLGQSTELKNAMRIFQGLVIGQAQRLFESTLTTSIGDTNLATLITGPAPDFKLKTILEEIQLEAEEAETEDPSTPDPVTPSTNGRSVRL